MTHTYTRFLSGPLHLCCVCFSELLKRQKTKSKEKRKEREHAILPSVSISSFSSADLANGLIELLHSLVLFSFRPAVFYLFPPALLLPSFISSGVFPVVFASACKAFFLLSDLIFFGTVTYTGLGKSSGQ